MSMLNTYVGKIDCDNIFQLKCLCPVQSLINLDNNDVITKMYDLNRGLVWNEKQIKGLITSIYEGVDIPKIYMYINDSDVDSSFLDTIKNQDYVLKGTNIINYCIDNNVTVTIVDGLQRTDSILKFNAGMFKTFRGLTINNTDIGNMLITDIPSDIVDIFNNYMLDITFIISDRDTAVEYFYRLNSGIPLSFTEKSNCHNNTICNWVRIKANVESSNTNKFSCFVCDDKNVSKLLNMSAGKRMRFDKILKQCMIYSLMNQYTYFKDIRGPSIERFSKMDNWNDISKIPLNDNTVFDLSGEVETIFNWINEIVSCPRTSSKINAGLFLNLYFYLHHLKQKFGNTLVLTDACLFAKHFFSAHFVMWENEEMYQKDTRKGQNLEECKNRLNWLLTKLGNNQTIGFTIVK